MIVILGALIASSCNEIDETELLKSNELIVDSTIEIDDGRIKFQTTESFNELIGQMHKNEKPTLGEDIYAKFEQQGFCGLNRISSTTNLKSELELEEDTLIPDPYFSALLNENREIEVNGVLYKINEYGTFFSTPDKLDEINEIINEFESKTKSTKDATLVGDNLYQVGEGVYMFDSQRIMAPIEDYDGDGYTGGGSGGSGGSTGTTSNSPYDDIEYHGFDAHTIVGGWIQAAFGRTRAYNRNFSSKRRIRVNFYSVNYVVYSGIGLNVKYQKKNWIGWSKTDCEELRWGWEGIKYSYELPYSMPATGPVPVRTEYTYVPGIKSKKAFTVNIMDHEISIDYSKGLKYAKNYAWDWLQNKYAAEAVEMREHDLSQFREIFPNRVEVVVNQYEEVKKNCDSFSKVFDWGTCEVSINFLNGSSVVDIVGLENDAMDFNVDAISVYGIAKRGSQYKGIGIVKEEE